jgi:hypothetical protein
LKIYRIGQSAAEPPHGGRFNDQSKDVEVSNFEKLEVSLEKLFNSRHITNMKPWSKNTAACVECKTTERRHMAKGLCVLLSKTASH